MWLFNKKKRAAEQRKKEIEATAQVFKTLEVCEAKGLLFIDMKQRRVFISTLLAVHYLPVESRWNGFLGNVQAWFQYRVSSELWERYFKDVEAKAVREAKKKFAMLTPAQIREIRFNARQEVDPSAVDAPEILPYDFVITSDLLYNADAKVVVVGRYEKGSLTMVPFNELPQ